MELSLSHGDARARACHAVCAVTFRMYTEDEKLRMAAVTVHDGTTYKKNGHPTQHGAMSPRMGTVSHKILCQTCQAGAECPGHYGRIVLARPLFQPCSLYYRWHARLLRLICVVCGACLVDKDHFEATSGLSRPASALFDACPKVRLRGGPCHECNFAKQPKWQNRGGFVEMVWPDNAVFASKEEQEYVQAPFTPDRCMQLCKCATAKDTHGTIALVSGISVPLEDALVIASVIVPPVQLRPPAMVKQVRVEDPLTTSIVAIVRANNALRKADANVASLKSHARADSGALAAANNAALKAFAELRGSVNAFMSKDTKGASSSVMANKRQGGGAGAPKIQPGMPFLLDGKYGVFRKNLCGKRTNNSGRSVIVPDHTLGLDEVGIPEYMATRWTVAVRVNDANVARLRKCIEVGNALEGAASVVTTRGTADTTTSLSRMTPAARQRVAGDLATGDIVHRTLTNGDYLILGRQPSLHKYNQQALKARLTKNLAVSINQSLCWAHHADFDGDTVSVQVLQGPEAIAEAALLMCAASNNLHNASHAPVYIASQDTITGTFKLSQRDTRISHASFSAMTMAIRNPRRALRDLDPEWKCSTENAVPGRLIFSLLLPPSLCYTHAGLRVVCGQIADNSGPITSAHVAGDNRSLLAALALDFAPEIMTQFLRDLCCVVHIFNTECETTTTGLQDMRLEPRCKRLYDVALQQCRQEFERADALEDQLAALASVDAAAIVALQGSNLQRARANGLATMTGSGSKGKSRNVAQLLMCVGMQLTSTGLMKRRGGRVFPCFAKTDRSPEARGFCSSSYSHGLAVGPFFFHCAAGRTGVVSTSCATPAAGYMYRRLYKIFNTLIVVYGGSVTFGGTLQVAHKYWDGFCPEWLERVDAPDLFCPSADEWTESERLVLARARAMSGSFASPLSTRLWVPLNLDRYYESAMHAQSARQCGSNSAAEDDDDPASPDNVLAVRAMWTTMFAALDGLFQCAQMRYHVADFCCRKRPSKAICATLVAEVDRRAQRAAVAAGQAVGSEAAASLCRSCAQESLSLFHKVGEKVESGTARQSRLLGIGRKKSGKRKPYPFVVTVPPLPTGLRRNERALRKIAAFMVEVSLGKVLKSGDPVIERVPLTATTTSFLRMIVGDDAVDDAIASAGEGKGEVAAAGFLMCTRLNIDADRARLYGVTLADCTAAIDAHLRGRSWGTSFTLPDPVVIVYGALVDARALREVIVGGCAGVSAASVVPCTSERGGGFAIQATTMSPDAFTGNFAAQRLWDMTALHVDCPVVAEDLFGVEACATTLNAQLHCLSEEVDWHHTAIVAEAMCMTGVYVPADRHGMPRGAADVIQRASFEEATKVLSKGALLGEGVPDVARSSSAALVFGTMGAEGTGCVRLVSRGLRSTADEAAERMVEFGMYVGDGVTPRRSLHQREVRRMQDAAAVVARQRGLDTGQTRVAVWDFDTTADAVLALLQRASQATGSEAAMGWRAAQVELANSESALSAGRASALTAEQRSQEVAESAVSVKGPKRAQRRQRQPVQKEPCSGLAKNTPAKLRPFQSDGSQETNASASEVGDAKQDAVAQSARLRKSRRRPTHNASARPSKSCPAQVESPAESPPADIASGGWRLPVDPFARPALLHTRKRRAQPTRMLNPIDEHAHSSAVNKLNSMVSDVAGEVGLNNSRDARSAKSVEPAVAVVDRLAASSNLFAGVAFLPERVDMFGQAVQATTNTPPPVI